ncbi:N-acetylglucosamine-6-phosphate deacetylase [Arthrobacter crystallopoietes]|uniref:N-acetylglucosamine 6-phosphate deacetylase n=1 Tax=Crystallibacter crystallopoietes TaxID=37928 RepID=A0A1H1D1T8_9MICC|nr:N-acetylglucosamine-6-phosphate deacetylase [Arthrobacter crystallopoietes]AUI50502.1 N-acetylglucosamine-6-phosphate deacetylase [Arthrobacter crystallopoietes]SDQ70390.1 N-acetylglucosamine 6-phosphate deacetylase [Arthrobacter crystallopoietes]
MRTVIHSARRISGGEIVADAWMLLESGRITDAGTGSWSGTVTGQEIADVREVDAAGAYLVPGFVDMHCHGGGGASIDDGDTSLGPLTHLAHGTTSLLGSLVTNPLGVLEATLRRLAAEAPAHGTVKGFHLEGPFLAASHCGAHNPGFLVPPKVEAVDRLVEAGGGLLRQVTIAPELDPGFAAVRRLVDHKVAVAVGHTDADYDTARAAFDAGASILTHAFNAMNGLHHRAPGPIAAAFDSPHVTLEVIADGHHVHDSMLRLAFQAAPGRVALITDAMAAAGCGDGTYHLGSLPVEVHDGVARLPHGGPIAGSMLTMDAALRRAVAVGIPLPEAVAAATSVPARAAGLDGDGAGSLAVGSPADLILLDQDLRPHRIWRAGEELPAAQRMGQPD